MSISEDLHTGICSTKRRIAEIFFLCQTAEYKQRPMARQAFPKIEANATTTKHNAIPCRLPKSIAKDPCCKSVVDVDLAIAPLGLSCCSASAEAPVPSASVRPGCCRSFVTIAAAAVAAGASGGGVSSASVLLLISILGRRTRSPSTPVLAEWTVPTEWPAAALSACRSSSTTLANGPVLSSKRAKLAKGRSELLPPRGSFEGGCRACAALELFAANLTSDASTSEEAAAVDGADVAAGAATIV
mmetsp:Transcript_90369/g.227386  ORF Transcript_90369/g.227386 Transcript_90369/m.227386 type:complete len:244 (+) Transcript_90369:1598-2329(+)